MKIMILTNYGWDEYDVEKVDIDKEDDWFLECLSKSIAKGEVKVIKVLKPIARNIGKKLAGLVEQKRREELELGKRRSYAAKKGWKTRKG